MMRNNWIYLGLAFWIGAAATSDVSGQEPAAATESSAAAEDSNDTIRFQLNGMPYMDALQRFAQMTGKPLLFDAPLEGTITFNDNMAYEYSEALDVMNLILAMKGMTLVEEDRFLRLVALDKVQQMAVPIYRGSDELADVRPGEIVTVVQDLRHLDPGEISQSATPMLSNAGSLAPLSQGRALIITDRLSNIRRIQELIRTIDTESSVDRQMKAYALNHSSGSVLSDLINRTFGVSTAPKRTIYNDKTKRYDELSPDPNDYVTAVFDDASRTLVLFGPQERILLAEELMQQFEDKQAGQGNDVRLYYPKSVSAENLARMIREAVVGVAGPGESASSAALKARLTVDSPLNRLIVTAPTQGQLESIDKVIETIDTRAVGVNVGGGKAPSRVTRIFQPQVAEPSALVSVLSNAVADRDRDGELQSRLLVTLEPQTGSLVVTGSSEDVERASAILAELERASQDKAPQETRFLEVGSAAEARRLAPLLNELFRNQTGAQAGADAQATIMAEPESGRLIVTAKAEHQTTVASLLRELRGQTAGPLPRSLETYELEHVQVGDVLSSLRDLVRDRMNDPAFKEMAEPGLLSDVTGNRVLITANQKQHDAIRELVNVLDVAPARPEREMSVVTLKSKDAPTMIAMVRDLMGPAGEITTSTQFPPRLMADEGDRKIIVLALPEDGRRIRELIERLDGTGQSAVPRQFRTVELYRRTASEFVPLVTQLYQEQIKGMPEPEGGPASLLAEPQSNQIMISGPASEFARVEAIIRQLDPVDQTAGQEETRVMRLSTAVATDLAGLVEKTLNANQNRQVTVLVDGRSNSLVISGAPTDVEAAAKLVQQLDSNPYLQPRQLRIFNLKAADAGTTAPTITDLFNQMLQDQRGPNYVSPTRVVADTAGNRLLVTGIADELELIASLVEKLDTIPEKAGGARVIPLRTAQARELLPVVTGAMTRYDANNRPVQRVTVSADEDSNSLVVAGSREDVQEAETIIQRLDSQARPSRRSLKILKVESSDVSRVASLTSTVFEDASRSPNDADGLRITADAAGQRLIVLAPDYLLTEVEQVVKVLDQEPPDGQRTLRMIPVASGRASELTDSVQRIYREQAGREGGTPATIMSGGSETRLAVIGTETQLALVESIVEKLAAGQTAGPRETRVFDLGQRREADRLLSLVRPLYEDQIRNAPDGGPADAQFVPDGQTGRIVVSASRDHLAMIETLFARFSGEDTPEDRRETRTFDLGSPEEAERISRLVSQVYQDQWQDRPESDPADAQFLPDTKSGRLYVTGRGPHLDLIANLVGDLSGTPAEPAALETRVYDLNTASASELADTAERIYEEQLKTRDVLPRSRTMILADEAANRLVTAGEPAELDAVEAIVEKLDQVSAQTGGTRVFHLRRSEAEQVASILSSALSEILSNGRTVPRVSVGADNRSNTLIVTGEPKDLQSAAVIIEQLDNLDPKEPRRVEIIPIKHGLASDMATQVRQLYLDQMKGMAEPAAADAAILGDDAGNRLILTGAESQLAMMRDLIARLDEKQDQGGRQMRVLPLGHQSAAAVASVITQLFSREIDSRDPAQRVVISAAPDDRTLIVDANNPALGRIEALVQTLDTEETVTNAVFQTVHLKKTLPDDVAEAVNTALSSRYPNGREGGRLQVVPVDNASSILLHGAKKDVSEAVEIIREIDQESETSEIEVRIYKVENGEVREISSILQQLLRNVDFNTRARRSRFSSRSYSNIEIDERNSRLIVVGNGSHFRLVEELLPRLDAAEKRTDRDIAYIWLQNIDADQVAEQVEDLYADRNRSERPLVNYDLLSNLLTVIGRPADLEEIRSIVERLDAGALDSSVEVRMIPVSLIPVNDVAGMLKNIYPQMSGGTLEVVDQLPPRPAASQSQPEPPSPEPDPGSGSSSTSTNTAWKHVVLAVDKESNTLLVSGPASELDEIDYLVGQLSLNFISTEAEFRQFPLREADPVVVARTLTELFKRGPMQVEEDGKSKTVTPAPKITVVAEPRTRSIIARGTVADFKVLESLIAQLDAEGVSPQLDYRVFVLEHAAPDKVLPLVQQMVSELNTLQPGEPVSITAAPRERGLFVVARGSTLDQIGQVIASLDTASEFAEAEVLVLPLRHANAAQLTAILQSMLRPGSQGELTPEARELQEQIRRLKIRHEDGQPVSLDLSQPIKIMADPMATGQNGGNRLILTSTPGNLKSLEAIVGILDRVPLAPGVEVKIMALQQADAATVSQTLTTVFSQGQELTVGPAGQTRPENEDGRALAHPLNVAVDARSNSLILSGRSETLALAERLVKDLDQARDRLLTEVKLYPLKYAAADRLAPMIQNVFAEVGGSPAMEGASTQITRLRVSGEPGQGGTNVATRAKARPSLVVQADEAANILIVAARSDVLPLIEEVIGKLDIPSASGLDSLRIYPLNHADATAVQNVINDLFNSSRVRNLRPEDRPNVTLDPRSNALIISGNQKAFGIIDSLVAQLDQKQVVDKTTFQVFQLNQATASKIQSTLQTLFAQRVPRVKGQALDPITLVADAWSNALIAGGTPEDLAMVGSLIERLDKAPEAEGSDITILPLQKADAARVAETVQGLYRDGTTATPVGIQVDTRLNALVVSAGEADRKRIEELVGKLDTDAVSRVSEIRVLSLKNARADSMATILNSAVNGTPAGGAANASAQTMLQFITRSAEGKELVTSSLKERVTITPDVRMNSLIVTGPIDYMPLLERIVNQLDNQSPQLAKIKVFPLENADAALMADVLVSVFRLRLTGGQTAVQQSVQYTLVRPRSLDDPTMTAEEAGATATLGGVDENSLSVTVDPRTNSLLVGGTDPYMELAEEIIRTLDSSPVQERHTEVYRLRNAQAPQVETALRSFLDQDRQRILQALGEDALGTAQRMLEREVAIVAEPVSNSLLLSANPRYFESIRALIESLDEPLPQVLIQALIAEATLDSTTELGVEWSYNGMDGNKTYGIGTDFGVADAMTSFGGFSSAVTGSDYSFLLRALQSDGRLHVLSRPQILTADNQPATINVGQRVPLITNSRVTENDTVINSVNYETVGVILTVTPRISPGGFVRMEVGTTNSALSTSNVQISETASLPIINERLATTTVSVQSGQSIIIGGLISSQDDTRSRRIPWLGNIPLLGPLFRSSSQLKDRKELLIFLTPQVLSKADGEGVVIDSRSMTEKQLNRSGLREDVQQDLQMQNFWDPSVPEPEFPQPKTDFRSEPLR